MISLELAKKLKDAGLEWGMKKGDAYANSLNNIFYYSNEFNFAHSLGDSSLNSIWLPSLSQLLTEVERRGWAWSINMIEEEMVPYHVSADSKYEFNLAPKETPYILEFSTLSTFPEEVAGQALLWILEREGKDA